MKYSAEFITKEFVISAFNGLEKVERSLIPSQVWQQEIPEEVSLQDALHYFENLVRMTNIQDLALILGSGMNLASYGLLGLTAMTQQNYRESLQVAERLAEVYNPAMSIKVVQYGEMSGLRIEDNYILKSSHHRYTVECLFASFSCLFHQFAGSKAKLYGVNLAYSEPSYSEKYKDYFDCPIRFDAEATEFLVSNKYLDQRLSLSNDRTAKITEENFFQLSAKEALEFPLSTVKETIYRLYHLSKKGEADVSKFDVEEVGKQLGMSGRTLRRKLRLLGTSFGSVALQVKKELSLVYLRRRGMSVSEISAELDFSDPSIFSKKFKEWMGESPSEYRKRVVAKVQTLEMV